MIQAIDSRFDNLVIDFDGEGLRIKAVKIINGIEYTRELAIPVKYFDEEFSLSTLLSKIRAYE